MADDDEQVDGDELAATEADEADIEDEPDVEDLDDEVAFADDDEADDEVVEDEDEDEDDEDEGTTPTRTKRRVGDEDDDEDDELLTPDDVEADLDRILKDRMVTAEDEDDDEDDEPDDRSDPGERLQPKRADEQLCPNCFLLVRASAPGCPVGDDDCPIFG